jgi:hypothetical protein
VRRAVIALIVIALALTGLAATATASDRLIVVKHRAITSFGGFAPQSAMPNTTNAEAVFGPGVVLVDSDDTCYVSYQSEGVTITFADFGNPGVSACDPSAGRAQVLVASATDWRTNRGLAVGDSLKRLKKLYRERKQKRGVWELVGMRSPIGPSGHQTVLAAFVTGGHVTGFKAFPRSAGE